MNDSAQGGATRPWRPIPGSGPWRAAPGAGSYRSSSVASPENSGADPSWRLFIAASLPLAALKEIKGLMDQLVPEVADAVRWTPKDNVHITLKFLGDTEPAIVGDIQDELRAAAAASSPLKLTLGNTGVFPDPRSPKILWVGLQGEARRLVQLQGRAEGAMARLNYQADRRPFTPHVTIGRVWPGVMGKLAGDVGFGWQRVEKPETRSEVPVDHLTLLRSHLKEDGPVYEEIFSVPLGGEVAP